MKGNNKMVLNQATMLEVLNHYFATVLFAAGRAPVAIAISSSKKGYVDDEFEVEIGPPADGDSTKEVKP